MKEELVQMLVKKVGLDEAMAETVVTEVVNFLAEKLPEPYGGLITKVLGGEADEDGFGLDDAADLLGGLFGGKK